MSLPTSNLVPPHELLFLTPFKQSLCEKATAAQPEIHTIFQKEGPRRNLLWLGNEGRARKLCRQGRRFSDNAVNVLEAWVHFYELFYMKE